MNMAAMSDLDLLTLIMIRKIITLFSNCVSSYIISFNKLRQCVAQITVMLHRDSCQTFYAYSCVK